MRKPQPYPVWPCTTNLPDIRVILSACVKEWVSERVGAFEFGLGSNVYLNHFNLIRVLCLVSERWSRPPVCLCVSEFTVFVCRSSVTVTEHVVVCIWTTWKVVMYSSYGFVSKNTDMVFAVFVTFSLLISVCRVRSTMSFFDTIMSHQHLKFCNPSHSDCKKVWNWKTELSSENGSSKTHLTSLFITHSIDYV